MRDSVCKVNKCFTNLILSYCGSENVEVVNKMTETWKFQKFGGNRQGKEAVQPFPP